MLLLYVLAAYLAVGLVSAVAFAAIGAQQVTHSSLTIGARILLLPGATLLWPYVLLRWITSSRTP